MSSVVDIQINPSNLEKIENFFKDASYRETIEFSANFNTRLGLERRLRLPFLDPQTGVAQNHSQLFVDKRHRMPGFRQGQIYTYPAARWRKSRRQYLNKMYRFPERPFQALRKEHEALSACNALASGSNPTLNFHLSNSNPAPTLGLPAPNLDMDYSNVSFQDESCSLGAIGGDTSDSKDSQQQQQQHHQQQQQQQQQHHQQQQQPREELPKEWFYDEMDMQDVDSLEDPKSPADDEYDYDPRYGAKKRRKRAATRKRHSGEAGGGGGGGGGSMGRRRRNRADTSLDASMESVDGILGGVECAATPTKSGRRPRGSGGPRGRRRTKNLNNANNGVDPPSPGMHAEPPSFDSVAAAVGGVKYM